MDFDVITVGGSVSGLLAAREVAEAGFTVKVFEEDLEVGLPERCDGLVSMRCLEALGVAPTGDIVQNRIRRAIMHSPSGRVLEVDAERQRVIVLDRSRFDRELAKMAVRSGVDLGVGQRVTGRSEVGGVVKVDADSSSYVSRWLVNASGFSSLQGRNGVLLPAAKFEVYGRWFDRDAVEIYFDQKASPGYFTWVIPISSDTAKVGVAGRGVNQFKVLEEFVKAKGGSVVKKTAAQIVVGGPIEEFTSGRIVSVGDAAGQAKPTTGGGIYSGGLGGILAGRYLAESLASDDPSVVAGYEKAWRRVFGREFSLLLRVRRVLERLDNEKIDRIFEVIGSSGIVDKISVEGDFDYHSTAVLKALGLKGAIQIAGVVAGDILTDLIPQLRKGTDQN